MTDDAIKALKAAMKADRAERAARERLDREAFWDRVCSSFKPEWETVKASGGQEILNSAINDLRQRSKTRELFRLSQRDVSGIASRAEKLSRDTTSLGQDIGLAVAALCLSEDRAIPDRANEMLDAANEISLSLDRLLLAIGNLHDVLPTQTGGPHLLSDKTAGNSGRFFREFAETAREVWRASGLSIGGNAVTDDCFSDFLDQVHMELFSREIPGRGALLADLRNTWPRPRF